MLATALSWTVLGVHPYYQAVPTYTPSTALLVWAVLAGPLLGAMGMAFVWLLGLANARRVRGNWILIGPVVAFGALGLLSFVYPQLLGNGRDLGENAFLGGFGVTGLAALMCLKPLVTATSWGSGASGGMFTPTTSYGALVGAFFGHLWSLVWPGTPAGAYALVGRHRGAGGGHGRPPFGGGPDDRTDPAPALAHRAGPAGRRRGNGDRPPGRGRFRLLGAPAARRAGQPVGRLRPVARRPLLGPMSTGSGRSRRVGVAVGLLAALGPLTAGCGSAARVGDAAAARRPGAGNAHGLAGAFSIDLAPADLPGYRRGSPGPVIWTSVEAGSAARCLGYAAVKPLQQVPSPTFAPDSDLVVRQVVSDVVVFRRASQAALIEHALAGNAAAQCLQGPLRRALEPAAVAGRLQLHKTVETTSLPMAPAGATDWFAYRLALTAAPSDPREHSFSIYDDLMGFRVGQDLVEINAYSARQLFPASQERDLLNLLYRRAARA